MTNIGVYARISKDVLGEGLGVQRQEQDCRALAEQRGWTVTEVYVDNDLSAYNGKPRPAYERMLADVRSGRLAGIVAWHADRLHRSPRELETFISLVDETRCAVDTVTAGELDLTTASGRMTARIVGAVARGESEHKSERIVRKLQSNAERGLHHGGERPFGWLEDRVSVNEPEAEIVRYVVAEVGRGGSLRGIARHLESIGSTNRDGSPWTETTVRNMAVRPRNVALRSYRGEIVGPGQWEPIVERDSWDAAMSVLSNPRRRTAVSHTAVHLLSGIATCGVCGAHVRASRPADRSGTRRSVYRCPNGHVTRAQQHVDHLVTAVVCARLARPDAADLLTPPAADQEPDHAADAAVLRVRLSDAAEDYADGVLTRAQLRAVTERLRPEIERLELLAQAPAATPERAALASLVGIPDVEAAWAALPVRQQKMVLGALLTVKIEKSSRGKGFDPETVRIEWRC